MNNKERHERRYKRRKQKRLQKRIINEKKYCDFSSAISIDALINSFYKCKKGVAWKNSVQSFETKLLQNVLDLHNKMKDGKSISKGYVEFEITERGKKRRIQACHISERVVQKSFCENCLNEVLNRSLIKNNCASQKGKGTSKALQYFEEDLRHAYKKWGRNFYIIQGDFKNYFASISHDKLIDKLDEYFFDKRVRKYYRDIIKTFYENGECIGLGLGCQPCQNFAIFYANKLDHYLEQFGRCGRFNDDFYLIVCDKYKANKILLDIKNISDELGLQLNEKKTQIVKATHTITFLKTRFTIMNTGKIIKRPYRKNIVRERRKLKKLKNKLENKEICFADVLKSYNSWKGSLKRKKCYKTICNMNKLFDKLYIDDWRHCS